MARLVAHRAAAAPAAKAESPKRALADTKKAAAIVQQARPRGTSAPGEEGGGAASWRQARATPAMTSAREPAMWRLTWDLPVRKEPVAVKSVSPPNCERAAT